jgi:phenylpropionate dioxygenase-like ring-hydroxylating dioxygenase large terminal subunit
MQYLRNRWYVAAWSEAVGPGQVMGRTILDQPIAFFRGRDGKLGAVGDRCPHRFAPLSAGKVNDDGILVCGYHGLGFGRDGACAFNPHGPVIRAAKVGSWPVAERGGMIWIWMGAGEACDPGQIPDFSWLDRAPVTAKSHGEIISGPGGYDLYIDNIMDLSHTDYLHADTLGQAGVVFSKPDVKITDASIEVLWQSHDARPPALFPRIIPNLPDRVDMTLRVRWLPAAVMYIDSEVRYQGMPEDLGGEDCYVSHTAHIFTPETKDKTHYFYSITRNFATEDAALNGMIAEARDRIFQTQDKPMIERVQARMEGQDFWDLKPLLLRVDEGGVQVRRRLKKLIEEQA